MWASSADGAGYVTSETPSDAYEQQVNASFNGNIDPLSASQQTTVYTAMARPSVDIILKPPSISMH